MGGGGGGGMESRQGMSYFSHDHPLKEKEKKKKTLCVIHIFVQVFFVMKLYHNLIPCFNYSWPKDIYESHKRTKNKGAGVLKHDVVFVCVHVVKRWYGLDLLMA